MTKRLMNLNIDEVSAVDKPAIGETFILIKSLNSRRGLAVSKTLAKSFSEWSSPVQKAVDHSNEKCMFCGITKEDEAKTLGLGLLCSVCFDCAVERMEKGVFDACISGEFDFEKFKAENPDDEAFKEKTTEAVVSTEEENKTVENLVSEERVAKLEKSLEEVQTILESCLGLHDQAAMALNEIVGLTFSGIDMVMSMMDEEEKTKEVKTLEDSIKSEIKVAKAGAKISTSRLQALKEISEKLAQLIESVAPMKSEKKSQMKKSFEEVESLKEALANLKVSIEDSIKSSSEETKTAITSKFEEFAKRLETIENSGVATSSINEDDDSDNEHQTQKSVFSDLIGMSEIKKSILSKKR